MDTFGNLKEMPARFKSYIEHLTDLFRNHEVKSIRTLISAYRHDKEFKRKWAGIWEEIANAEGGKLSLTTIGIILGSAMGGVGIAALGGAIGLPLFAVLGLAGLVGGSKFDATGYFANNKIMMMKIPKTLYRQIEEAAENSSVSPNDLMIMILEESFASKIQKIEERTGE
ncbi:MAG: hypothetical protein R2941_18170 [Desulfobacterales bacterium]